ncbi:MULTISPECIES: hypothetical protein [unclassified Saccharothrix]|uniref:hypothetical protein n=1 Tax=unclassified Saccharothrix TaxID=2593673 RepID=UPI00307DE739
MADERASKLGPLLVVAVLTAVCVTAWAVWGKPVPASAWNVPPTGEAGRIADDPLVLALGDFGAHPGPNPDVRAFANLVSLNFLHESEIAIYTEGGAGPARLSVGADLPRGRVLAAVVRMADPAAARHAADRLDQLQLLFGLERRPTAHRVTRAVSTPPGSENAARPTARAHYASGDLLVRIQWDATSPEGLADFDGLLERQTKALPAHD